MPRRLSPEELDERIERVAAARERGLTIAAIAESEGMSERTVKRTIAAAADRSAAEPAPVESGGLASMAHFAVNPDRELIEALRGSAWAAQQLRAVAGRTRSDALRIGAAKAVAQLGLARVELLVKCGWMPTPAQFETEGQWIIALRALLDVAKDADLDLTELREALDARLAGADGPTLERDIPAAVEEVWAA